MSELKEVRLRHRIVIRIAKTILTPIIKKKYNYQFTTYKELKNKGPFLILGNHTVALDPILMGLSFVHHNYYIATEQIFNLGFLSKLLVWAVNPIKKSKSVSDMATIRKAKTIVNQGGSIGVYPEGNLTYTGKTGKINNATIKLIRLLKIPVIIFVAEGLFFSNPRWSIYRKKGPSTGYIKKIIYPDEYQNLDDQQLTNLISELLDVDAYHPVNIPKQGYFGKEIAAGLERLVFMDLKTNKPFVTYSKDDLLLSNDSDFKLRYDQYGYLHDEQNIYTLSQIQDQVFSSYLNYLKTTPDNLIHQEEGLVAQTINKRKVKLGNAIVSLYKDQIKISTTSGISLELGFADMIAVAIQGKDKIIIYYQDQLYLVTLDHHSAPLKYLLAYQYYKYIQARVEDEHIDISKFGL